MTFPLELALEAESDIDDILEWSASQFGEAIRNGYEALLDAAILSIQEDPDRPGSRARSELGRGIRSLHLTSSQTAVGDGARKIARPRHFIVYRQDGEVIQVLRVLHDAMDLPTQRMR